MTQYKIPTLKDLKEIPKDTVVDAVIVDVIIQTWKEKLDSETLKKFKQENHNQAQVFIKYDCTGIIREDSYTFYEEPPTNSKLGKFMLKYNGFPETNTKIRVDFDKDSKSRIRL